VKASTSTRASRGLRGTGHGSSEDDVSEQRLTVRVEQFGKRSDLAWPVCGVRAQRPLKSYTWNPSLLRTCQLDPDMIEKTLMLGKNSCGYGFIRVRGLNRRGFSREIRENRSFRGRSLGMANVNTRYFWLAKKRSQRITCQQTTYFPRKKKYY
jgi:hypothetical protein